MAALKADSSVIFNPVVPAMLVGILWVLTVAYIFGRRERARLGIAALDYLPAAPQPASLSAAVPGNVAIGPDEDESDGALHAHAGERKVALERPWLFWFNTVLTVVLIIALLMFAATVANPVCPGLRDRAPSELPELGSTAEASGVARG
jgi:CitMHS family citrate-Mg2+:H+ or citrate-Ca2+:H+ symporter